MSRRALPLPPPPSSPELRRAMRTALPRPRGHPKPRTRPLDDIMSSSCPIDAPPPVARAREAVVYDAVLCVACGSGDREDELLLCDGCDRGYHTFCLHPIYVEVPSDPWSCPDCAPPAKPLVEGGTDESDESERDFQHVPSNPSTNGDVTDNATTSGNISKPTDKRIEICNVAEDMVASHKFEMHPLPCPPPFKTKIDVINLNQGKKPKRIKIDEDTKLAYAKYVSQRILKKGFKEPDKNEPPPFVQIAGFYVSYDEFYGSLKQRGKIDNNVMALWTCQFNLDEAEAWADDNSIMKKYAFSSIITDKLIVEPAKFIPESCERQFKRLNNKWNLSRMDLIFFPIVRDGHWAVTCINMILKQTLWFNSVNASTETPCFNAARNLINNFSKAAMQSGVLKEDVSQYEWKYPTDYPQQNTTNDCGPYTMLYMESWNGKKMDVTFEQCTGGDYRKMVAGILLLSPRNEIATAEFVQKYCNKE